jgi:glycosyltransferase involved in cell wall biosynthesis
VKDLSHRTEFETAGHPDSGTADQGQSMGKDRRAVVRSVLHLNTSDRRGGAATLAFGLQCTLNLMGVSSSMMVHEKLSDSRQVAELPRFSPKFRRLTQHEGIGKLFDLAEPSSWRIQGLESFRQADILHLHNLHGHYFNHAALPSLTRAKPTVWTLHDLQELTPPSGGYFHTARWIREHRHYTHDLRERLTPVSYVRWRVKEMIFNRSDLVLVAPSDWLARHVEESLLCDKPLVRIDNGVDPVVFRPHDREEARQRLNLPRDKILLLFIAHRGTQNTSKGGGYFEEILARLADANVCLVSIGGEAGEDAGDSIISVPYVAAPHELALYYSAADLFVYPSIHDNCPLVVLEAMACQIPVVSFRTGGIPEIVVHGETGFLAERGDIPHFVQGIRGFLNDEVMTRTAGEMGRKRVLEKYTLPGMAKNYLALYERLCQARG